MRELLALVGLILIVAGAHQLFGPWADVVLGCLLIYESHSMKTGDKHAS
jgi:hypothetical protein